MTRDLALSLLHTGNTASEILSILDTITSNIEQANIDDCAAHYASISVQPTLDEVQF